MNPAVLLTLGFNVHYLKILLKYVDSGCRWPASAQADALRPMGAIPDSMGGGLRWRPLAQQFLSRMLRAIVARNRYANLADVEHALHAPLVKGGAKQRVSAIISTLHACTNFTTASST